MVRIDYQPPARDPFCRWQPRLFTGPPLRWLFALLCLVALPGPASAGMYSVTYSGGYSNTITAAGTGPNTPYTLNGSTGFYGANIVGTTGDTNPVTVKGLGTITATFTWMPMMGNPADVPPSKVLIEQTSNVLWGIAGNQFSGSGSRAHGLSAGTVHLNDQYDSATSGSTNAKGWTWKDNPGQSFTITASPVANATNHCTQPPPGVIAHANMGVSYKAAAYPVTLTVGGTIQSNPPDSIRNILIGQQATGSVSAGPATITVYQWTFPGMTFADYVVADDDSTGDMVPLSNADRFLANPQWYWRKDETVTVSCTITASIRQPYPQDYSIGQTTVSQQVKVWAPYYSSFTTPGPSGIYGNDEFTSGGSHSPEPTPPGILFENAVGTPALFSATQGYGRWDYVQLCSLTRIRTTWSGAPGGTTLTNGYVLDNLFPYDVGGLANSTATNPNKQFALDSPGTPLDAGISHVKVDDQFRMHIMYLPPGANSRYVPLHRITWSWTGEINWVSFGVWPSNNPIGQVTKILDQRWYDHPEWTEKFANPH